MKISRLVAAAILTASIPVLAADTDVAVLEAIDQAWASAFNTGNIDAVANIYDENAVLLPPGAPTVTGKAAIRAFFKKQMDETKKAGMTISLAAKPASGVSGDMAWLSGTYSVKDKSGKVAEAGKYVVVATKKNGKWLYLRDAWNSNAPPPPSTPAKAGAQSSPPKAKK